MKKHSKHLARQCAVQALFQWNYSQGSAQTIIQEFTDEKKLEEADKKYFRKLVIGILENLPAVDAKMALHLDRPLETLNPIELAILRLGVFELLYEPKVPYKVAINESLEIAKEFGSQEGHKYVNAVLDAVAKTISPR